MVDPNDPYGLGLEPGGNRLADPNPLWPQAFAEEAARIRVALGRRLWRSSTMVSPAVPRLCAKPIIDLQIGVAEIEHGLFVHRPLG